MKKIRRAAVDTNLLLLVMYASLCRDPSRDTRVSRYGSSDISLIRSLIGSFDTLVTSPNVISEVNTMLFGYEEYEWLRVLLSSACEIYVPNQPISESESLAHFGITDLGFLSEEFSDCCIITDDRKLSLLLEAWGREVILYSNYREEALAGLS